MCYFLKREKYLYLRRKIELLSIFSKVMKLKLICHYFWPLKIALIRNNVEHLLNLVMNFKTKKKFYNIELKNIVGIYKIYFFYWKILYFYNDTILALVSGILDLTIHLV